MALTVEGTDIEIGKWYLATQKPPKLTDGEVEDKYSLILGIKDVGPRPGFYEDSEDQYFWHCERYDSFDDEPIPGWTREQEINNNLDWVYEIARGVCCWMVIPDFDNELPSIDGLTGFDPDPDEEYGEGDDSEDFGPDNNSPIIAPDLPLHLN